MSLLQLTLDSRGKKTLHASVHMCRRHPHAMKSWFTDVLQRCLPGPSLGGVKKISAEHVESFRK
eukprot:m.200204 g.200204  ORF g.200204 m.200204 type:complete len:64 (+) comp39587_c0_seq46:1177-1368(+)